jgi:hypothetical protein
MYRWLPSVASIAMATQTKICAMTMLACDMNKAQVGDTAMELGKDSIDSGAYSQIWYGNFGINPTLKGT